MEPKIHILLILLNIPNPKNSKGRSGKVALPLRSPPIPTLTLTLSPRVRESESSAAAALFLALVLQRGPTQRNHILWGFDKVYSRKISLI